jgi:hypothetical protein
MAKLSMPTEVAKALSIRERMLLFCIASDTDRKKAAFNDVVISRLVAKGLVDRKPGGRALSLTDLGRAVLRAMLPDL